MARAEELNGRPKAATRAAQGEEEADDGGEGVPTADQPGAAGVADDGAERPDQEPGRAEDGAADRRKTPAAPGRGGRLDLRGGADEAIPGRRDLGVRKLRVMTAVAKKLETRQPAGELDGVGGAALRCSTDGGVPSAVWPSPGSSRETVMAIPSFGRRIGGQGAVAASAKKSAAAEYDRGVPMSRNAPRLR